MGKIIYKDLIAFHPGYYVREYIENQGITQKELAQRLRTSAKYVSDLVNGLIPLTDEMALKLSIVFGTSVEMWLNLNKRYTEKKLEIEKRKCLDEECELMKLLDYKFWVNLELVKATKDKSERVQELLRFFKVSSLNVIKQRDFLVQYKTSVPDVTDVNVMNANAWVQTAINIGMSMEVKPFDEKKLRDSVSMIRDRTLQNPEEFYPTLKKILSDCGVALVLLPNLKNCGINGAVKWMGKEKVFLALNDRGKSTDTFWFSLFHELGHVFQQRVKVLLVSGRDKSSLQTDNLIQRLEKEANEFAQETLIPSRKYDAFLQENPHGFTEEAICTFARKIHIQPGIVVGRLQRDKKIGYQTQLNNLKEKYIIE